MLTVDQKAAVLKILDLMRKADITWIADGGNGRSEPVACFVEWGRDGKYDSEVSILEGELRREMGMPSND